jgi:hypothetical protein
MRDKFFAFIGVLVYLRMYSDRSINTYYQDKQLMEIETFHTLRLHELLLIFYQFTVFTSCLFNFALNLIQF